MSSAVQEQILEGTRAQIPVLDERFAALKKKLVKPEHKEKVIESYAKLLKVLESEVALIEKNGPSMIPEINFEDVQNNGGALPLASSDLVRDRGCVILRNVVPESQAIAWESELREYTNRYPAVGGFPRSNPQTWNLFWTPPQVEIRSHPAVLTAMRSVSKLWRVADPSLPIDLSSQVAYPDRFRIRHPSTDAAVVLPAHLDSGAIERWEDPANRANYAAIFEGDWARWDGWLADGRLDAKSDLYATGSSCSCWRSMQGWLSLSRTGTGEGTLRLLPSLKASVAYLMLRPLFLGGDGEFDDTRATFPGATPGKTQLLPTEALHPHLALGRTIVGIPPVKPGDYVFWHCDLVHEVDRFHPGTRDSSVVYNACTPLTPYNIESLVSVRDSFRGAGRPRDFNGMAGESEASHPDHGARNENILSEEGMRAMGFQTFVDDEEGLTGGQKDVRRLANGRLGLA